MSESENGRKGPWEQEVSPAKPPLRVKQRFEFLDTAMGATFGGYAIVQVCAVANLPANPAATFGLAAMLATGFLIITDFKRDRQGAVMSFPKITIAAMPGLSFTTHLMVQLSHGQMPTEDMVLVSVGGTLLGGAIGQRIGQWVDRRIAKLKSPQPR